MNKSYLLSFLIILFVAGCSAQLQDDSVNQYPDSATGVTVSHLDEPLVFVHETPRLAAHVRDYLYLGPLEINRTGKKEFYIWAAEWSTVDYPLADDDKDELQNLTLVLDGSPIELTDLFDPDGRYHFFEHPYVAPVKSARTGFWRVSRDLFSRISLADVIVVELPRGEAARRYRLWRSSLSEFAALL